MWGSESCTTIIIFPFGHLSDRERTATGREHNPHTTEPSIDCQHRKCGFLLSRSKRQTSFLLLSVADRIVGNRAREQYSDCYLLSERRSLWPGRSAGCRPVPSNRARQKARQPASPRPRTRSSNPAPSSGESTNHRFPPDFIPLGSGQAADASSRAVGRISSKVLAILVRDL